MTEKITVHIYCAQKLLFTFNVHKNYCSRLLCTKINVHIYCAQKLLFTFTVHKN